jgi:hypothetical protein
MVMRSVIMLHVSIYPYVPQTAWDMLYVPENAGSSPICPEPSAHNFHAFGASMLKGCRCHGRVVKQFHHSLETSFKR